MLGIGLGAGVSAPAPVRASSPEAVALSPRNASYSIDARLDVWERTIDGRETLTWTNVTEHATDELRFHLYYNAWRNNRSSFLSSERYGSGDFSDKREHEWAYIDVSQVKLADGADLTEKIEFIQPDDGNEHDRTVLRVPLDRPVGPGETIELELAWTSRVPRTFARTGARGDYFFLAQWFPKVGVLEGDGEWACHQFIQTEFYADFGVYDVRLTVPEGWVVGATGREEAVTQNGDGSQTHRFVQADVHDFAWTTSPLFSVHEGRFEHAELPPVDIRLLLMPDHADQVDRYLDATRTALEYYGSWWGAYPYGHITVVDPAYRSGTGGMEYPTLFTGGSRWLAPPEARQPESVTVHECGHQFWYGIVANDEFTHAWLDEGFNSYTQARVLERVYPEPRYVQRYLEGFLPVVFGSVVMPERTAGADQYAGFESVLKRDPIARESWTYGPQGYRVNSYNKPAMLLRTLENYLGWEVFQRAVSTYFSRWKFRHPTPDDFIATVEEVSGQDLDWYFDQAYRGSEVFDYAVDRVSQREDEPSQGRLDTGGKEGITRASVFVRRWGEGVFPIDVKVVFDDGSEVIEHWDGKDRWMRFDYAKSAKVERVIVDPERVLVLDVNRTNDSWLAEPASDVAATKWASRWMLWVQHTMETFAFFS